MNHRFSEQLTEQLQLMVTIFGDVNCVRFTDQKQYLIISAKLKDGVINRFHLSWLGTDQSFKVIACLEP